MTPGDTISGYKILKGFSTAGGGLSRWTTASKGGKVFFLKEFLAPTFPTTGSPGSDATKELKRKRCQAFEDHHRRIMRKLSGRTAVGGNLVVASDFFRHNAKYYKVTELISFTPLRPSEIASLSVHEKRLVLLTVAHSLRVLHQAGIVHGDLKPDNLLIKRTGEGAYVAKLIDFDDSYESGNPPDRQEALVGDPVYYSPETYMFIKGGFGIHDMDLALAADIFSLGLIYCQFTTGTMPRFDKARYQYACEAAASGSKLEIAPCDRQLRELFGTMLSVDYHQRPSIDLIFKTLKGDIESRSDRAETTAHSSTLKGTLLRSDKSSYPDMESKSSDERKERILKGTLLLGKTPKP